MSAEYYVRSFESGLWTVGRAVAGEVWTPYSDHDSRDAAEEEAFFLNHGRPMHPPVVPVVQGSPVDPWDLFAAAFITGNTSGAMSLSGLESLPVRAASFADAMMRQRAKRKEVQA